MGKALTPAIIGSNVPQHDKLMHTSPHFMLVPSLGCPAACGYCFGPHQGPVMSEETLRQTLAFIERIAGETGTHRPRITFHGGEPLMAGYEFWAAALTGLRDRFGPTGTRLALQSNLWLLDEDTCALLREHRVEIGTSLDGPEAITDQQRGGGYFRRTMAGIKLAESLGMSVGCIATFTPASLPHWREIFDFFISERLGFSIHVAVKPLGRPDSPFAVPPDEYGALLVQMFDYYIRHRRDISVNTFDQMIRGVATGDGQVCSFRDCLGMFLAIDPEGDIFACQRFAGRPEYRLGTLADHPSLADLLNSPVAKRMADYAAQVSVACGGCTHLDYCRGGCPYNAWANGEEPVRDPLCAAYRHVLDDVQCRMVAEMATPANLETVAAQPWNGKGHPMLRRGPMSELASDGLRPTEITRAAKRIVAAVELAKGPDIPMVAERLVTMGIARTQQSAELSLAGLARDLQPREGIHNNLYLHLTFHCQLTCTHCYACADASGHQQPDMPVEALARLLQEAKVTGFRQVVLTGGEPLVHSDRTALLAALTETRRWAAPMNVVLRTNFAMPLTLDDLRQIASAVDQVVVSVDGDDEMHDARRGQGSYAATVANLEAYAQVTALMRNPGELSLAAVLRAVDINGPAGASVRNLAQRLAIRRVRFRPLLPLGRAAGWEEPPTSEALDAHADPLDLVREGFHPVGTCGFGQNLYVEPAGDSFPCYAYHKPHALLGNVIREGLAGVVGAPAFVALRGHNVDSNPTCRRCEVRYLCGGACRAWGGEATQADLDASPNECHGLKVRATTLAQAAQQWLDDKVLIG